MRKMQVKNIKAPFSSEYIFKEICVYLGWNATECDVCHVCPEATHETICVYAGVGYTHRRRLEMTNLHLECLKRLTFSCRLHSNLIRLNWRRNDPSLWERWGRKAKMGVSDRLWVLPEQFTYLKALVTCTSMGVNTYGYCRFGLFESVSGRREEWLPLKGITCLAIPLSFIWLLQPNHENGTYHSPAWSKCIVKYCKANISCMHLWCTCDAVILCPYTKC